MHFEREFFEKFGLAQVGLEPTNPRQEIAVLKTAVFTSFTTEPFEKRDYAIATRRNRVLI